MTTVYFIRHAKPDTTVHDDRTRPLTAEGLVDCEKVAEVLRYKGITHILSSPYKRTMQTVGRLSEVLSLPIETDEDFRERNAGGWHGDNFLDFIRLQWADFGYHIMDGECLEQVQRRNIAALKRAVEKYADKTLAIATHGTALSTMLNYFNPQFDFEDFMKIVDLTPYVVKMEIDSDFKCCGLEEIFSVYKEFKRN